MSFTDEELQLGNDADFVAAIGPQLTKEWSNKLGREVIEIVPGIIFLKVDLLTPCCPCHPTHSTLHLYHLIRILNVSNLSFKAVCMHS